MSQEQNVEFKSTFERAIVLMAYLANQSAHPVAYNQDANSWIKDTYKRMKECYDVDFWKEVFALNTEQKLMLGFRIWYDENALVIPLWIIECLPDDFDAIVESINGQRVHIKDINKDTRAGCVAYTMIQIN